MKNNLSMQDLATKGFITVAYPPELRAVVLKTVDSWKAFCALSDEVKLGLPYSNGGAGVGYELKNGEGDKVDRKENFDVTIEGKKWLEENISKIGNAHALRFVEDAVKLASAIKPLIVDFAEQVEKEFGIHGLKQEVIESENRYFIRFIRNPGNRKTNDVMTEAHPDQSAFTPHLFESAPGLQCLTYDGQWIDMPVSEGETVIIPAMQMQLRSEGKLRALCHRVIAKPETADGGRYSAVCFVQLKDTPKYDKDRWGRLQKMAEGFNYSMSPNEFSKFFK